MNFRKDLIVKPETNLASLKIGFLWATEYNPIARAYRLKSETLCETFIPRFKPGVNLSGYGVPARLRHSGGQPRSQSIHVCYAFNNSLPACACPHADRRPLSRSIGIYKIFLLFFGSACPFGAYPFGGLSRLGLIKQQCHKRSI